MIRLTILWYVLQLRACTPHPDNSNISRSASQPDIQLYLLIKFHVNFVWQIVILWLTRARNTRCFITHEGRSIIRWKMILPANPQHWWITLFFRGIISIDVEFVSVTGTPLHMHRPCSLSDFLKFENFDFWVFWVWTCRKKKQRRVEYWYRRTVLKKTNVLIFDIWHLSKKWVSKDWALHQC